MLSVPPVSHSAWVQSRTVLMCAASPPHGQRTQRGHSIGSRRLNEAQGTVVTVYSFALSESQANTLFTQPPSESATISDSLAPKHYGKQAKEKATTKKSQKSPLWLTSFVL